MGPSVVVETVEKPPAGDTAHLKPLLLLLLFGQKTILTVDADVENVDDTSYSGK